MIIEFIRNLRSALGNRDKIGFDLVIFSINKIQWIEKNENMLKLLFKINKFKYSSIDDKEFDFLSSGFKFGISSRSKVDNIDEINKKIKFYKDEIKFFEKKLKNKNFVNKAPLKIVNENKAKLKDALKNLDLLKK